MQTALLGSSKLTAQQYANADVTGDGAVNGLDLSRLRQMIATVPVSDAIAIHLSDSGITVEGDTKGVTAVSGKTVTISASGNYTVDGTITDGQILVNVADTTADSDAVSLYLQGVTMTSSTGAPCILGQSAGKLKLTCSGINTLTDTAAAVNADTSGVIYGDCDITVTKNSTGTLTKFISVQELAGGSVTPTDDTVATALVYNGSSVTATNASGSVVSNPSNLTISGANVTVTASGELSVNGESTSGQLAVNVDKTAEPEGKVVLNLEGLTLSNDSVAPIYVEAIGDEVQISAKNGTTNTISDGTSHTDTYVDSDGNTNPVNGAIFSRDDLKLKGKGTLIVNGNTEDGIVCKNDLKIWNGSITVNAADDGIRGNDSVRIGDPDATDYSTLSVTVNTNNGSTGGDGIKSNSTETDKGYITINGGTVNINAYADGIQAEQTFTMNGGDLNITTYQGSGFSGNASGGWAAAWR